MKHANIGVVNLIVSNQLKDAYFSKTLIEESKRFTTEFFGVVKKSPILQLEFKVFNNLEAKHIENDIAATRYIDNNIKLFEVYTLDEVEKEREKLDGFIGEGVIPDGDVNTASKINLYNAIDCLIRESLNDYDKIDVDAIHESFNIVLNHIKQPKKGLIEDNDVKPINEEVIEIAVNKFNEKYESLNENDKNLLQRLIKSNDKEKQELFESYRDETLQILEGLNKDNIKDNISKAIQKIKEMVYNKEKIDDDIIGLHEFKKELL
ncbi:MAG: hypothetical protein WC333_01280 [Dehalococcoidia bacterium]|jgi:hypothetical protein